MDKKFIFATKNKHKLIEIKEILNSMAINVLSMEEVGFDDEVEENGTTFEENSILKARAIFNKTGGIVMADDSGLEIDYLGGSPGVFSARFAGENASDTDRINKVLGLMKGVAMEKRTARYVCSISVIVDKDIYFTVRGTCSGLITTIPVGTNGFGYDPIFYVKEYGATMAELSSDIKNTISHRKLALLEMKKKLSELL